MWENLLLKLKQAEYECFVVGGAVRDMLRNKEWKDVDLATNATPDQILKVFKDWDVREVGKSFGVMIVNGIEIATYRKDRYSGLSDKKVEISYSKSIDEDLERRDFTINSIAWDPTINFLVDPFEGQKDLKDKILRFTGDPEKRIFEDPNRILRAARFVTVLDFEFSKETFEALKKNAYLIKHVAKERIHAEILKTMVVKKASKFFEVLRELDILKDILPSLQNCVGVDGGPWHNEDVWTHSMLAGDYISPRFPLLKFACYVHDIGKPSSINWKPEGGFNFVGHEKTGSKLAEKELQNLTFPSDQILFVKTLILLHMKLSARIGAPGVRRCIRDLQGRASIDDLLRLFLADYHSNLKNKEPYNINGLKRLVKLTRNSQKEKEENKLKLAVDGHDVMNILNIPPGNRVGYVIKIMEEMILDDPSLNEREGLLKFIETFKVET